MTQNKSTLFRSEEMSLVQLFIPVEVAHTCVAELGQLGKIQFKDLNPNMNAFQRPFVAEIKRLDEMERQCRYLESQIKKSVASQQPPATTIIPSRQITTTAQAINDLQETLQDHKVRIQQLNDAYETLVEQHLHLTELQQVLLASFCLLFNQVPPANQQTFLIDEGQQYQHDQQLGYITGVIPKEKMLIFQRIVWRSTRGNVLMNFKQVDEPIIDPRRGGKTTVYKDVFVILAHGHELMTKIKRISENMGATLYTVDQDLNKRQDAFVQVSQHIQDVQLVLSETTQARKNELIKIANNINNWFTLVQQEKAIDHTLNLFNFDINRKCLVAEGWCPQLDLVPVHLVLQSAIESSTPGTPTPLVFSELAPSSTSKRPTFHRVNKFTKGFQAIIDAYGIAHFGEVNPGLFTIVSFPFLFAVMFGDMGHGLFMLLFALYLVLNENKLVANVKGEIFSIFFSGRYMLLTIAVFSIFTGWIYNDFFSLPLHLFQSGFDWLVVNNQTEMTVEGVPNGNVYPFGLDSAWHGAENALLFTNSYKMKQAIILGVLHMSFAICLNVFNHIHFKKKAFILLEFLPQILFMESIFGYLVFCILFKWSINWYTLDDQENPLYHPPPNLLNMLIYMFLTPGKVDPSDQLYPGQAKGQLALILVALVCVPWMWFAKPLYLKWQHEREGAIRLPEEEDDEEQMLLPTAAVAATEAPTRAEATIHLEENEDDDDEEKEEEFDFSEEMIHQTIHTIEFCLNCISNTASYLRLWALSLAHAQLSSVLWDMTLKIWFSYTGIIAVIGLVVGFAMWFVLTIGILLCMEGLSAFLHALRLHWVEFDGKFYMGDGVPFEPFSFRSSSSAFA